MSAWEDRLEKDLLRAERERDEAKAEIERLRAALRELIGEYEVYQGNVAAVTWARARAALEGKT